MPGRKRALSPRDRYRLAVRMRGTANLLRMPALPDVWPDWMSQAKREEMADGFEKIAGQIEPARPARR